MSMPLRKKWASKVPPKLTLVSAKLNQLGKRPFHFWAKKRQMLQEVTKLRKMRKALENMDGSPGTISPASDSVSIKLNCVKATLKPSSLGNGMKSTLSIPKSTLSTEFKAAEKSKRFDSRPKLSNSKELRFEYAKKKAAWDEYLQPSKKLPRKPSLPPHGCT